MTQPQEILVSLDMIHIDSDIASKEKEHIKIIEHFAKVMRDGKDYPSVICFLDGKDYRLIYGINLLRAAESAEQKTILVDVHTNPCVNPRSQNDKRRIVKKMLSLLEAMGEEEKSEWSTRKIGAVCNVSNAAVSNWGKEYGYRAPDQIQAWGRNLKLKTYNIAQSNKLRRKANEFNWAGIDDKQFENIVYAIVNDYHPIWIVPRTGTGGKGRDIEARFKIKGGLDEEREERYFIEVKHHKNSVNWVHLSKAFTWAEKYKPSVLVIAVSSHLSNSCSDEVSDWEKNHPYICVIRWERKKIEELVLSKPSVRNLAVDLKLIPKSRQREFS